MNSSIEADAAAAGSRTSDGEGDPEHAAEIDALLPVELGGTTRTELTTRTPGLTAKITRQVVESWAGSTDAGVGLLVVKLRDAAAAELTDKTKHRRQWDRDQRADAERAVRREQAKQDAAAAVEGLPELRRLSTKFLDNSPQTDEVTS